MTASKQPKPDPQERADLFLAQYQAAYSDAISAAREAAATTATPAWRAGYDKNMKAHREVVASHLQTIDHQCETIRTHDTAEDFEKDIRDAVKGLGEERIRFNAWRTRTITAYEEAANRCADLLLATKRAAEEAERKQPLLDRGLSAEIGKRLSRWPHARWNDETGAIEITESPANSD